jgi:hypothetical protein
MTTLSITTFHTGTISITALTFNIKALNNNNAQYNDTQNRGTQHKGTQNVITQHNHNPHNYTQNMAITVLLKVKTKTFSVLKAAGLN